MLCPGLFHAGGMGLWHGVEHWERNKIMTKSDTELFTDTWDEVHIRTPQYIKNSSCLLLQKIVATFCC